MYGPDTKVSINVSPPLFLAAEFLPMFRNSLSASKADPKNVVIEITEEVFASSLEEIVSVTNEIRKMGADISLDDFGSGFSSLSYLRAVHFDEIKIDRSFVQILGRDPKGNILLSAITDLGLALGSRMVAEGVETQAQLETVQNAGCDIIQGYFYSKPIALAELA
jgi:EAL domain-containing protein (putative c-di-GMP-specific phosphodiesterase class I)